MSAAERIIDLLKTEGLLTDAYGSDEAEIGLNRRIRAAIEQLAVIELRPAHSWDCDHCGKENFQRAVVASVDEIDVEEYHIDEEGFWLTLPTKVKCSSCGTEFLVRDYSDPDPGGQ
jgi:hypothetical protein